MFELYRVFGYFTRKSLTEEENTLDSTHWFVPHVKWFLVKTTFEITTMSNRLWVVPIYIVNNIYQRPACSRLSVDSLSQHLNDFQDHIKTWFLHMGTCAMSANYNIWLLPWLLLHCVYKQKEAQHAWWLLARTNVSMQLRVLHDSPLNVTRNTQPKTQSVVVLRNTFILTYGKQDTKINSETSLSWLLLLHR